MGKELLGCTLSPSRLQTNTIHIAQYGRLSWLQRAGIFIWFTPDLQQPLDIKKMVKGKVRCTKKMEPLRNQKCIGSPAEPHSPSTSPDPNQLQEEGQAVDREQRG